MDLPVWPNYIQISLERPPSGLIPSVVMIFGIVLPFSIIFLWIFLSSVGKLLFLLIVNSVTIVNLHDWTQFELWLTHKSAVANDFDCFYGENTVYARTIHKNTSFVPYLCIPMQRPRCKPTSVQTNLYLKSAQVSTPEMLSRFNDSVKLFSQRRLEHQEI